MDERVRRSRETVLKAASELLTEAGLGGVSVDEVSRRSGVAKTTIYRHWPTRSDLILDACSQLSSAHEAPDTGTFEGDVTMLLWRIAELLRTARWASVLPSIMDAAERDADVAKVYSAIQRGHAAPFLEIVARAKKRGEVRRGADATAIIASLVGPLYYRRWFSHEPIDEAFVQAVLAAVFESYLKQSMASKR